MTLPELRARLDRYRLCAEICAPDRHRTAYRLMMMCCAAAAVGFYVAMPVEWGWPKATDRALP